MNPAEIEWHADYAAFRPEGRVSVPSFLGLVEQAMKACKEKGLRKLLVDGRNLAHNPLATLDWFDIGNGLAQFWDREMELTMVGRPDQLDPEKLGVMVAANRGLRYSVHTDEAEAVARLRQRA